MKKILLMALVSAALSFTASAATIAGSCVVNPVTFNAGGIGGGVLSCVSFDSLGTGGTLTSSALTLTGDYVLNTQLQVPLANLVVITFTPDVATGFAAGAITMSNLAGSFTKVNDSPQIITSGSVNPAAGFQIAVTSTSTQGAAGVDSSNGSAFLVYTYSPTGEVPEPTTFVLLGAGLVGLGIYRRRMA